MSTSVLFIGGGQISRALIGGLLAADAQRAITVIDPNPEAHRWLQDRFASVELLASVEHYTGAHQVVILAVKPQLAAAVLPAVAHATHHTTPLYISVMAGVSLKHLRAWLQQAPRIARAMPNRPALIGLGVSGLARESLSDDDVELARATLSAVGPVVLVNHERDIDAVTAISGSGPAYFFLLLECLERAGTELGLAPETVRLLACQTAFGAAAMALRDPIDLAELRAQVTSKGGTTEAALAVLRAGDFERLVNRAVKAAQQRAAELAEG